MGTICLSNCLVALSYTRYIIFLETGLYAFRSYIKYSAGPCDARLLEAATADKRSGTVLNRSEP